MKRIFFEDFFEMRGRMLPGYEEREIPEDLTSRPAPPDNVFCYPLVDSWRTRVWNMLGDLLTEEVKVEFVRKPPEYVVSDDLSWLDKIVLHVSDVSVDIKALCADRLCNEYTSFRAYHGTRTDDLGQYYERGLRVLRTEEIEERARSIFLNERFKLASEERLQSAINELSTERRGGYLYFCADQNELTSRRYRADHYLCYGSEYLQCLGMRIVSKRAAEETLKSIGRPTMFVCDIPMSLMRRSSLLEFSGMILEYIFCELVEGLEPHALSPGAGSALRLTADIPAKHIVGHFHPRNFL